MINRTKPHFGKKEAVPSYEADDPWACVRIPLMTVASYFVLKAIVRYTSGSRSTLDQVLCFGALLVFISIMLLGIIQGKKDSRALEREKQQWKGSCKLIEVAIVKRHGFSGGSYEDEYGISHTARANYSLTLRLPNQLNVNVDVSERVFVKLEQRNLVRIYYNPESPLVFLLEEELL